MMLVMLMMIMMMLLLMMIILHHQHIIIVVFDIVIGHGDHVCCRYQHQCHHCCQSNHQLMFCWTIVNIDFQLLVPATNTMFNITIVLLEQTQVC